MKKLFNTIFFIAILLIGVGYSLDFQWTSFSKSNKPVMMPATAFCSGSTVSGAYASGGDCYFKIGESGANYSIAPLVNASGTLFFNRGSVATGITEPGSDILVPTEKATVDYIASYLDDIGDALISGHLYFTGGAVYGRIGMSGESVSLETFTGGQWVAQPSGGGTVVLSGTTGAMALFSGGEVYSSDFGGVTTSNKNNIYYSPTSGNFFVGFNDGTNYWTTDGTNNIVLGYKNYVEGDSNTILGGITNKIAQASSFNNFILGGTSSTLYGTGNGIIGGEGNSVSTSTTKTLIFGGKENYVNAANGWNVFLGGYRNYMDGTSTNNYILGKNGIIQSKDDVYLYSNSSSAFYATKSGAYYVNAYGGMYVGGGLFDMSNNAYITGIVTEAITRPGTGYIPTTKAVVDYIDLASQNLGDIITTGGYYISASGTTATGDWRITTSGGNLSFQRYDGANWVEKGNISQ